MKSRSKFGIGCLVVILLVAGFGVFKYYSWRHETEKNVQQAGKYVLKALNIKYKKDFVIDKGHYIYNTGGYEFTVHPKGDPDFTFNAWLNGMTESGESDMYLIMSQANEGKKMVAPFIKSISSDYYISSIGVNVAGSMKEAEPLLTDMHKNNLTAADMLKKYPDKMGISFTCHINYKITSENENNVLKKVYSLIEFLKEKKFGYIQFTLYFYNFSNKNIKKLADKSPNFSLNYKFKAPVWLGIYPEDILKIKKYQDIKKYLIYMKTEGK